MASKSIDTNTPYPVCSDLSKVTSLLKEYGVCVIPNVFTNTECDSWMGEIVSNMEAISGNQVNHKQPETWNGNKLPPQVRYGMYHNLLNNLRPVWEIRRDPRMKNIFKSVYSELSGRNIDDFVCSIDGINVQPNISRNIEGTKDWPHVDQTEQDNIFKCVQGQVVLTNTAAGFVASPTSHKYFRDIMKMQGFQIQIQILVNSLMISLQKLRNLSYFQTMCLFKFRSKLKKEVSYYGYLQQYIQENQLVAKRRLLLTTRSKDGVVSFMYVTAQNPNLVRIS